MPETLHAPLPSLTRKHLPWLVPAAFLVLFLLGSFLTRGAMSNLQFLKNRNGGTAGDVVNQQPLQTAQALYPLAVSAEEQNFAHEALRIADHEVDQAFAMALRQANAETRTLTGKALEVSEKVTGLEATVKQDQAALDALTVSAKARPNAGTSTGASSASVPGTNDDDLDIAKAQLALDTDELSDAQNNLAVVSGDRRGKIQEELATHEAGMKKYDDHTEGGQVAVLSARRYGTLAGRIKGYFEQRSRLALIEQARSQADADTASLTTQLKTLQQKAPVAAVPSGGPAQMPSGGGTRLIQLRRLEAQKNILGILDDRIEGQKELSANYAKWVSQVELQHRIVLHLLLNSLAWVALIVLCAVLAVLLSHALAARRMTGRSLPELRSMQTLRTVLQLAIEALALLLILLVLFGAPSQVPTILGLATAGLTVVFQDHILAFFGWFVLMTRNGIRVGDWVEIAGVGGEVVDIGLFRTTLLETGNWTDKGHPTGRRISFVNKFAMSGQYFNFSTDGQWMWDEITLNLPAGDGIFVLIDHIRQALVDETAADTAVAEDEWQRATQRHGLSQFSAKPTVEMRPAAAGIDIVIRYVTRAADRLDMRNRLSQAVIQVMHAAVTEPVPAQAPAAALGAPTT